MDGEARGPGSIARLVLLLALALLAGAGFFALGVWQVHRLAWKEALIARVERNVNAVPAAAPGPGAWPGITPDDEYRRVRARGRFEYAHEVTVAATTELGSGYWVLTPLRTQEGAWLLVNRGFVPMDLRAHVPPGPAEGDIVGLLRLNEPHGRLLQTNVPAAGRWYSRDVVAIAAAQGLAGAVAPYFIDEVATPDTAARWPRAGLTVLQFPNNHLVYAITWFALAAMMAAAFGYVLLDHRRSRRPA
ncbi:SURF1 family protein [Ramlibacter sp.]|uniref:SURF1 family protein n=1 Tax=Ramlibacter sp. TaxID=1917967 RepID=UPI00263364DE|nr:SURF1 family protein [Ramlibacter sp.]MDB5955144.1 Surfeit locus 1 family protein [Ramlibacter sp.]